MLPRTRIRLLYAALTIGLAPSAQAEPWGYPHFEVLKPPRGIRRLVANDVAVRRDGMVVLGTQQGLGTFDGERWKVIRLPTGAAVESVAALADGRILSGLQNDFGIFEPKNGNPLTYRSLKNDCNSQEIRSGSCMQIFVREGIAYFGCQSGIAVWPLKGNVPPPAFYRTQEPLQSLSLVNDRLLAAVDNLGIMEFNDGDYTRLVNATPDDLPKGNLIGCCSFGANEILVASDIQGMTIIRDGCYERFDSEVSQRGQELIVKGVNRLGDDLYLILTESGVCLFNSSGIISSEIKPTDQDGIGQCNNRACIDAEGTVWIPMQHSGPLAKIDVVSRSRRYDIGREEVHWVSEFEDSFMASSGDAVIRVNNGKTVAGSSQVVPVALDVGRSRGAVRVGNELCIATTSGLGVFSDGKKEKIGPARHLTTGAYLGSRDCIVFGALGRGFSVYRRDEENWFHEADLTGTPRRILQVVYDDVRDAIWFSAEVEAGKLAIFRLDLTDADLTSNLSKRITRLGVLASTGENQIALWHGRVLFNTRTGVRQFDDATNGLTDFEPPSEKTSFLSDRFCATLAVDSADNLWVATLAGELVRIRPDGEADWPRGLSRGEVVSSILAPPESEFVWLRTIANYLVRLPVNLPMADSTGKIQFLKPTYRPSSDSPEVTLPQGEALLTELPSSPVNFRYATNSIASLPESKYQFRLSGLNDKWSEWTTRSHQTYRSLPPAEYTFEVRSRGRNFEVGEPKSFSFRILPRWYNTRIAWLGYSVLALVLTGGTIRWRTHYAQRRLQGLERIVAKRTSDLHTSTDRYRWLIEGIKESYVFFTTTSEGTIIYASPSIKNVLGYEHGEIIGRTWGWLTASEDSSGDLLDRSSKDQPALVTEADVRHKDGTTRRLEFTDFPLKVESDDTVLRECIAKDITQLKKQEENLKADRHQLERRVRERTDVLLEVNEKLRAEIEQHHETTRQLHESELRYRSIVEDQTEMIVLLDVHGRIKFANPAFLHSHDLTMDAALKTNISSILSSEDFAAQKANAAALTPDTPTRVDVYRFKRSDGSIAFEEWHGRGIFDDDGQLITFQAVGRNITDLVETQRKLTESELQYRSIVEDQREMIVRFDRAGLITFSNSIFAQEHGCSPEELLGRSVFFAIHPDDLDEAQRKIAAISADNPFSLDTLRSVRHDGSIAWREWNGRGLFNESGELLGYQGVGRDITALHETRKRLEEKEEQLAHLGRVSALGEMVAGISHEINQPLATIANFASASKLILADDRIGNDGAEKLRNWATRIARQTDKIDAIIRRLRRFGRPGSQRERFEVGTAVAEALLVTETRTRTAVDEIDVNCDDELPLISADRVQVEQVIVNMIRNACDAMEAMRVGDRRIKINVRREAGMIVTSVNDSGPGISEDLASELFQTFVTSKSEGMGIGLAISRSIVEAHGGSIRAVPGAGHGSFEFSLPIDDDSSHA